MAKKSSQIANELFNLHAANHGIHASRYKHQVACPLCLRRFERSSIHTGELTVEHIVLNE